MNLITCYDPLPISFTHGQGVWLFDENNQAYLDATSGIAVCGLGHAHPAITQTISKQANKLLHTSNAVIIKEQMILAERLTQLSGTQQVFFSNSGAEANEAAIKLTRLFGHKKNIAKPSIIVMERAFHGRTMATLTASGSRKVQAGYEPLVAGFIRAPFNDLEAIHTIAESRDDVVAIMLEPIQGEGGIHAAEPSYLKAIAELCNEKDWLFILDEIQTGNARTGPYFAFMDYGVQPDILTTAKGLGNGIPIAACLIGTKACDLFRPGNHGSTFGGNPFACATALTVLEIIEKENISQLVAQNSIYLKNKLMETLHANPHVKAIRGKGYLLGIEFDLPMSPIKKIGLENGILLNVTAENVIRLLPPLIIKRDELDELCKRLSSSLDVFFNQNA